MTLSCLPAPPAVRAGHARRVALYSHDTQGLGHVRRNIALASALVDAEPHTDVLLLTGAPEATTLPLPPRTDVITLPTLRKDASGRYAARTLGAPLDELLALRSTMLTATLTGFAPDLLVVDKVARGVDGELDDALLRLRHSATRVVLGLREVLDTPEVVRREWQAGRTTEAVRELYDAVWVYGDRDVYDLVSDCRLPVDVVAKTSYTGYLGHGRGVGARLRSRPVPRVAPPAGPYVLCLVGGGQDGLELADAFARAPLPHGHEGVVLTGPYLRREAREALRRAAAAAPGMSIVDFVPDAERFVAGAAAVVSMAGYNSVCELLAAGKRTLLVPRTTPRAEQLVRARSLARRGLVDVLDPELADPRRLAAWTAQAVLAGPPRGQPVDLGGLARVPLLADALLAAGRGAAAGTHGRELADVAV